MAGSWREVGRALLRWGRQALPFLVSGGLVTWLIWSVSPGQLFSALSSTVWPWLVAATLVQLIILFLWDAVSQWWLLSLPDHPLPFWAVFRERVDATLWTAVNVQLGQGVFTWNVVRKCGQPSLTDAFGRTAVLGLYDFGICMVLGFIGSFLKSDPLIWVLRWVCLGGLVSLLILELLVVLLPAGWRDQLVRQGWLGWLTWWRWRHSLELAGQRLVLFLLVLVYAGVGLALCGFPADIRTVLSVIPLVLVAEGLPSTGGLGQREVALVYLLQPETSEQRATLLSFGLIWSVGIILGRLGIGLVGRWLHRREAA